MGYRSSPKDLLAAHPSLQGHQLLPGVQDDALPVTHKAREVGVKHQGRVGGEEVGGEGVGGWRGSLLGFSKWRVNTSLYDCYSERLDPCLEPLELV